MHKFILKVLQEPIVDLIGSLWASRGHVFLMVNIQELELLVFIVILYDIE